MEALTMRIAFRGVYAIIIRKNCKEEQLVVI